MTLMPDSPSLPYAFRDDDEGLFSRDFSGQLVRLDAPTEDDYTKDVNLKIDGKPITVKLAEPLKDAQGNVVLDIDNRTTPRYTTIYDAAVKLYGDESKVPIPVLCHQQHMKPVAVCRLCVVQIWGMKRGKMSPERKLLPACQHQVKEGMEVYTREDPGKEGEKVRKAVAVMTELLTCDHLKDAPAPAPAAELAPFNELQKVADLCGIKESRFKLTQLTVAKRPATTVAQSATPPASAPDQLPVELDSSSPVFLVDHSACILCDRCARACNDVKGNNVIGRTGKGANAGIGFDLDDPMGDSSCVQCGECMVSCPTSAITFKPVARVKLDRKKKKGVQVLSAAELKNDPLFAGVPGKFLLWQEGLVTKSKVEKGDVLCRQGEPGNTAFLIKSGKLQITAWPAVPKADAANAVNAKANGKSNGKANGKNGAPAGEPLKPFIAERTVKDEVVGEMSCLSGTPRTADVTALEPGEIWEVRRNVLDRIMRSPTQRARFEERYRGSALDTVLRNAEVFQGLPKEEYEACVKFLRPRLSFVRANPGQSIFSQGDWADAFFLVRLGHIRVGISQNGREASVLFKGPGTAIGEIGLLALSKEDAGKTPEEVDKMMESALSGADPGNLGGAWPSGRRTAACSALDHLELARVGREDFLQMILLFPSLRRRLIEMSLKRLGGDGANVTPVMREYVEQGLYQGQSLLVLDLEKCTRCDECTRACRDEHGTDSHGLEITRLLREGLRFGNSLVATSCRSCKDAYCMIGCPVDSIHRGKHQQIVIEDHCIGCGLCASNCPFGNISMLPNLKDRVEMPDPHRPGHTKKTARSKASTCDLCDAHGELEVPKPRCVYACPHDAAHRMTGAQLLATVTAAHEKD